jgi:Protein of unknown function (DUF2442).
MKTHAIHFVKDVVVVGPYTLKLLFEDSTTQVINFEPVLRGQLYGALRDLGLFNKVRIDPEVRTVVWPNGADFDPATLHDWPTHASALAELAQSWELCTV